MSLASSRLMTLVGLQNLSAATNQMNRSLTRLTSGFRINTAADDPAGSIFSQYMSAQLASLQSAIDNTQQASSIVNTASGAVSQIVTNLQSIRSLVMGIANGSGLTSDEIAADQAKIDTAVEAINHLIGGTTYDSVHLLDGSQALTASGLNAAQVDDVTVYSARFGGADYLPVNINVTTSAQTAQVTHTGATIVSAATIQVQGKLGTATLSFASGTAAASVVAAINGQTANTGVSATLSGVDGIRIQSTTYGSNAFVSVSAVSGKFAVSSDNGTGLDYGRDAVATVNGRLVHGQGLRLTYSTSNLSFSTTLDKGFGAGPVDAFEITGGGMYFQLGAGDAAGVTLGIPNLNAATLGGTSGRLSDIVSGGSTEAANHAINALKIVDEALQQTATLNGRLGGFATYTLQRNADVLENAYTQLSVAHDAIVNDDFATETVNFYRSQMLSSASLWMLQVANRQAASLLTLLPSPISSKGTS